MVNSALEEENSCRKCGTRRGLTRQFYWTKRPFAHGPTERTKMTEQTNSNSENQQTTILVLEAFERVHKARMADYERMGSVIDDQVKDTEPGMLVHALTKISESDEEALYRWLEVFDSEQAFEKHLSNPHVIKHVGAMNEGVLCGETELVIYSDWTEDRKNEWRAKISGVKLTFAPMLTSYFLKR